MLSPQRARISVTPGRVTILGESDATGCGASTRRPGHPQDPDRPSRTLDGIGRTTRSLSTRRHPPETYIAVSERRSERRDLHVIERIHLDKPDVLRDDLEIIRRTCSPSPEDLALPVSPACSKIRYRRGRMLAGKLSRARMRAQAVFVPVRRRRRQFSSPPMNQGNRDDE